MSNKAEFIVVGCGDAFGSGGQLNTCFFIRSASGGLLIDCGATSLSGLRRQGVSPDDIDVIVITHFHGDHFAGLPFLLLDLAVKGRTRPLVIISPPGCKGRLEVLLSILYPSSAVLEKLNLEFREFIWGSVVTTGFAGVEALPVIHTPESLPHGVKIFFDRLVVAYSGDTEWTENLILLSENADLFICECCFFSSEVKGHLNYQQIFDRRSSLRCKKLLLTHFDQEMLIHKDVIALEYAEDGKRLWI